MQAIARMNSKASAHLPYSYGSRNSDLLGDLSLLLKHRRDNASLRQPVSRRCSRRFVPSASKDCPPMSLLNLRIRGRLYAGFGILLVFCAGLAAFGVSQLGAIREQVDMLSLQSQNTIRVGEITTELQAIRRGILRYTFDQDEASFAESDKRLARSRTCSKRQPHHQKRRTQGQLPRGVQGHRGPEDQARRARRRREADAGGPRRALHGRRQDGGRRAEIRGCRARHAVRAQRQRAGVQGIAGSRGELADAGDARRQGFCHLQDQCWQRTGTGRVAGKAGLVARTRQTAGGGQVRHCQICRSLRQDRT